MSSTRPLVCHVLSGYSLTAVALVVCTTVLSGGSLSRWTDDTVTWFVAVPSVVARRTTVADTLAPTARLPIEQVRVIPVTVQVLGDVTLYDTSCVPVGIWLVMTTPVAGAVPVLVTTYSQPLVALTVMGSL